MRPPGAVLTPGESIIATGMCTSILLIIGLENGKFFKYLFLFTFFWVVFKFVELPENDDKQDQKSKVKFKIMSLKVEGPMEYVPELVGLLFHSLVNLRCCLLVDSLCVCARARAWACMCHLIIKSEVFLVHLIFLSCL